MVAPDLFLVFAVDDLGDPAQDVVLVAFAVAQGVDAGGLPPQAIDAGCGGVAFQAG
jgi:hypothetical protein